LGRLPETRPPPTLEGPLDSTRAALGEESPAPCREVEVPLDYGWTVDAEFLVS